MPNDINTPAFDDTATSPKLEISGMFFPTPIRYSEGHVLTQTEAVALDQVRRENLRNIFAKKVKKAQEGTVTPEVEAALTAEFSTLEASYTFTKTKLQSALDPIEKKAWDIASEMATAALQAQKISKSQLAAGVFDDFVQRVLDQKPEIMEEARNQIENARRLAGSISLAGLGGGN
jgi:hypothetical protein